VELAEKHPVVGDVRGAGLHHVIELVRNQETREPLSEFNAPLSVPMQGISRSLREQGMMTFVRWNMIFNCPPLVVDRDQIQEGLDIIDRALDEADEYYVG
jgi:taurine--2-oxoglutarate transaminase